MFTWNQPEAKFQVDALQSCRQGLLDKKKSIHYIYGMDPEKTVDIRSVVFSKYINTINSSIYGHLFLDQDLRDLAWWQKVGSKQPHEKTYALAVQEWEIFLRWGLFHTAFSIYESFLRILIRAIDPSACSFGTAGFQSIYTTLCSTKLSAPYPQAAELSNLMRLIRNTIHNNGLHVSPDKKATTVCCNSKTYTFGHMQALNILTWSLIIELLELQGSVVHALSIDPVVKALPHIEDEYITATEEPAPTIVR